MRGTAVLVVFWFGGLTGVVLVASLPLIIAVVTIALVAWLVRTLAESDPDPLILNFTFFAFAAQCILTREDARLALFTGQR